MAEGRPTSCSCCPCFYFLRPKTRENKQRKKGKKTEERVGTTGNYGTLDGCRGNPAFTDNGNHDIEVLTPGELKTLQYLSAKQLKRQRESIKHELDEKCSRFNLKKSSTVFQHGKRGRLRFVLIGNTGVGRSSTGNLILGKPVFEECHTSESKTSNIQVEKAVVNGAHIELIDTPGFENTKRLDLRRMASEVTGTFSGSNYGFLFVFNSQSDSLEEDQQVVFTLTKAIFGLDIASFSLIILTHGDTIQHDDTSGTVGSIQEYWKTVTEKTFADVMGFTFDGPMVVVDNKTMSPYFRFIQQEQLVQLLQDVLSAYDNRIDVDGAQLSQDMEGLVQSSMKEDLSDRTSLLIPVEAAKQQQYVPYAAALQGAQLSQGMEGLVQHPMKEKLSDRTSVLVPVEAVQQQQYRPAAEAPQKSKDLASGTKVMKVAQYSEIYPHRGRSILPVPAFSLEQYSQVQDRPKSEILQQQKTPWDIGVVQRSMKEDLSDRTSLLIPVEANRQQQYRPDAEAVQGAQLSQDMEGVVHHPMKEDLSDRTSLLIPVEAAKQPQYRPDAEAVQGAQLSQDMEGLVQHSMEEKLSDRKSLLIPVEAVQQQQYVPYAAALQSSSCPDGEVDRHPQKQHDSGKNEVCVSEKAAQQQCHVHDHQGLQIHNLERADGSRQSQYNQPDGVEHDDTIRGDPREKRVTWQFVEHLHDGRSSVLLPFEEAKQSRDDAVDRTGVEESPPLEGYPHGYRNTLGRHAEEAQQPPNEYQCPDVNSRIQMWNKRLVMSDDTSAQQMLRIPGSRGSTQNRDNCKRVVSEPDLRHMESPTSHAHAKAHDWNNHKSLPKLSYESTL